MTNSGPGPAYPAPQPDPLLPLLDSADEQRRDQRASSRTAALSLILDTYGIDLSDAYNSSPETGSPLWYLRRSSITCVSLARELLRERRRMARAHHQLGTLADSLMALAAGETLPIESDTVHRGLGMAAGELIRLSARVESLSMALEIAIAPHRPDAELED